MGHYDLYGNSYSTAREALNAETAQCNEIDNYILRQQMEASQDNRQRENHELWQRISMLEDRITSLEQIINQNP